MNNLSEVLRLFIGIKVNSPNLQIFEKSCQLLKGINGIRVTKPENLHLTIKFLGDVEKQSVEKIHEVLEKITETQKQFSLKPDKLAGFPNLRFPKVVLVTLETVPAELLQLHQVVDEELQLLNIKPEKRHYNPHYTLGRMSRNFSAQGGKKINGFNECFDKEIRGEFNRETICGMELIQSILTPTGPDYRIVKRYTFRR